jgi:hypothetical protein
MSCGLVIHPCLSPPPYPLQGGPEEDLEELLPPAPRPASPYVESWEPSPSRR